MSRGKNAGQKEYKKRWIRGDSDQQNNPPACDEEQLELSALLSQLRALITNLCSLYSLQTTLITLGTIIS